jgi:hypothetical protein
MILGNLPPRRRIPAGWHNTMDLFRMSIGELG